MQYRYIKDNDIASCDAARAAGANISIVLDADHSSVTCAIFADAWDVLDWLLEHDADPNARRMRNPYQSHPAVLAAHRSPRALEMFLKRGLVHPDSTAAGDVVFWSSDTSAENEEVFLLAMQYGLNPNAVSSRGCTALWNRVFLLTILGRNPDPDDRETMTELLGVIKLLIAHGANPHVAERGDKTSFDLAIASPVHGLLGALLRTESSPRPHPEEPFLGVRMPPMKYCTISKDAKPYSIPRP